jgi:folate-dependent phosphoribosylglycinamide formyltransferase PurN
MKSVAVICENDRVWNLPVWERSLPLLQRQGYTVQGIWTCPARLSGFEGSAIARYYLRTFGILDFIRLCLFAGVALASQSLGSLIGSRAMSFQRLCRRFEIHHGVCAHPNDPRFIHWLKENKVDVLVTMAGHILKKKVLRKPRSAVLNKHASLLPANRGLLPYFWATLADQEQGVSFHKVIPDVDSGEILVQELVPPGQARSLVEFYATVHRRFSGMLIDALDALQKGAIVEPSHDYPASYHGLPGREECGEFKRRGGRIIRWRDIPSAWSLGQP